MLSFGVGADSPLSPALSEYENTMVKLAASKDPSERNAAITALGILAAPEYEAVRDRLANDRDNSVKLGLLKAIDLIGDQSSMAKRFVIRCLASDSPTLIMKAKEATNFQIDFRQLWNPAKPLFIWKVLYHPTEKFYSFFDLNIRWLNGVGTVRPWKDPAWRLLRIGVKHALLERAGTKEAMEILKKDLNQDEAYFTIAEPVDTELLRKLLSDPNPALQRYAAHSLVEAKEKHYIQHLVDEASVLAKGQGKLDDIRVDGINVVFVTPFLSTPTIKALLKRTTGADIENELLIRSEPFMFEELSPQNFPYATPSSLTFYQIRALVRERCFPELPIFLERMAHSDKESKFQNLSMLHTSLNESPNFLADLPEDVAHECYGILREKYDFHDGEVAELAGILARGTDADELWATWQRSERPFADTVHFNANLSGFSKRSAEIREILGAENLAGSDYFPYREELCLTPYEKVCRLMTHWSSERLPAQPASVWKADLTLAQNLLSHYSVDHPEPFLKDFLELRGILIDPEDVRKAVDYLNDPRFAVRDKIWRLFGKRLPYLPQNDSPDTSIRHPSELSKWLKVYRGQENSGTNTAWALPGPELSQDDESWLRDAIQQERNERFKMLVETPNISSATIESVREERIISPQSLPQFPDISLPTEMFVDAGYAYVDKIEGLLNSPDQKLRSAARWALWKIERDPRSIEAWMEDARSNDSHLQIQALYILQYIHYKPASTLYEPLLQKADPAFRLVDLYGVAAFRVLGSLDKVRSLAEDANQSVAAAAISTLGSLHVPKARDSLIRLLDVNEMNSEAVLIALRNYQDREDIDRFAQLLDSGKMNSRAQQLLLNAACFATYQTDRYCVQKESDLAGNLQLWRKWWISNRNESTAEWFRAHLSRLVSGYLNSADPENSRRSGLQLAQYFPGFSPSEEQRVQFSGTWDVLQHEDLWNLLAVRMDALPRRPLPQVAIEIDRNRTLKAWLSELYQRCSPSDFGKRDLYQLIVTHTGEEFGNPCDASCEIGDEIISNWIQWSEANVK
jgi:HEAT repeat protein